MQLIYDMIWHMSILVQIIEYYGLDRTDIQCIVMSGGWLIHMFNWYLYLATWLHSDETTYFLSSISHITPPTIECYDINLLRAGLGLVRHRTMFDSKRPGGCRKMIWLLLFESIHIFSFIAGNLKYLSAKFQMVYTSKIYSDHKHCLFYNSQIDGLEQVCHNSIANALELLHYCNKPSKHKRQLAHITGDLWLSSVGLSVSLKVVYFDSDRFWRLVVVYKD